MNKILVIWSNYYADLAQKQLDSCLKLLNQSQYNYHIEKVEAGTYEIPAVIHAYQRRDPHDGYLPLSLLLKGSTDHYEFIWEHVKECFIQFTLQGLMIGNGIISAPSMEILTSRVENEERVTEAFRALDYLLQFKNRSRGDEPGAQRS